MSCFSQVFTPGFKVVQVMFTYVAKKEEWQKKSETSPHPGLESLWRDTQFEPPDGMLAKIYRLSCTAATTQKTHSLFLHLKNTQSTKGMPIRTERVLCEMESTWFSMRKLFCCCYCCCYSGNFLKTSAQGLWCRLTTQLNFQLCPNYCPRKTCC